MFKEKRSDNVKILEIGIWSGASLFTWSDYFENGLVTGFDIEDKSELKKEKINIFKGDQSKEIDLKKVNELYGPFDIIIDDGSHMGSHQLFSFETLFPLLNPNGFYVIEDCLCAYHSSWNDINIIDRIKQMVGEVNMNGIISNDRICANKEEAVKMYNGNYFEKNIEYIFVSCGTCIIKKIK